MGLNRAADRNRVADQDIRIADSSPLRHARKRNLHQVLRPADLPRALRIRPIIALLIPFIIRHLDRIGQTAVIRIGDVDLRKVVEGSGRRGRLHQRVQVDVIRDRQRVVAAIQPDIVVGRIGNANGDRPLIRYALILSDKGIAFIRVVGQVVRLAVQLDRRFKVLEVRQTISVRLMAYADIGGGRSLAIVNEISLGNRLCVRLGGAATRSGRQARGFHRRREHLKGIKRNAVQRTARRISAMA